jgi:uncharacterized membrane protein YfcA
VTLEWWQYALLTLAAAAAGFIDAIAGGGGLITLPALLWAGLPAPLALGTNKLQSTFGTSLAVWRFARAGLIVWRKVRFAVAVTFCAAVLGTWATVLMPAAILKRIIPAMLLTIALYTALNPGLGQIQRSPRLNATAFALLFGCILGFYDGFFGPGTGSFWILACVLARGQDLREATGTTKAVNLASNIASLLAFAIAGRLRWDVGGTMIVGQLCGARLGSGLVLERGGKIIRPIFIATALALALKLAWDAFAG